LAVLCHTHGGAFGVGGNLMKVTVTNIALSRQGDKVLTFLANPEMESTFFDKKNLPEIIWPCANSGEA